MLSSSSYKYGPIKITSRVPWSKFSKGDELKFCYECGDLSRCKERVRGTQPALIGGRWETILVDFYVGECGHITEDQSS